MSKQSFVVIMLFGFLLGCNDGDNAPEGRVEIDREEFEREQREVMYSMYH